MYRHVAHQRSPRFALTLAKEAAITETIPTSDFTISGGETREGEKAIEEGKENKRERKILKK